MSKHCKFCVSLTTASCSLVCIWFSTSWSNCGSEVMWCTIKSTVIPIVVIVYHSTIHTIISYLVSTPDNNAHGHLTKNGNTRASLPITHISSCESMSDLFTPFTRLTDPVAIYPRYGHVPTMSAYIAIYSLTHLTQKIQRSHCEQQPNPHRMCTIPGR
jgi:hypothetical protein